jgi:hypothetical protein
MESPLDEEGGVPWLVTFPVTSLSHIQPVTWECLLIKEFNPFTFKVIIDRKIVTPAVC